MRIRHLTGEAAAKAVAESEASRQELTDRLRTAGATSFEGAVIDADGEARSILTGDDDE